MKLGEGEEGRKKGDENEKMKSDTAIKQEGRTVREKRGSFINK
jgi:hypothetical protein